MTVAVHTFLKSVCPKLNATGVRIYNDASLQNVSHFFTETQLLLVLYFLESFPQQRRLRVFQWSLSASKSPQISRNISNILAALRNVVVWRVSTCPHVSKSSSPFINPLGIVSSASITIGILVSFMLHSLFVVIVFFFSTAKFWYF